MTEHEGVALPALPTKRALRELAERDPALGAAMKRVAPFPQMPPPVLRSSHFHAVARSIIFQQLANAAATTIYGRVRDLSPGQAFPTATELLALPDERLRGAGLSGNKARAIKDLATRVSSGELGLETIDGQPDGEVVRRLTTVWGIGEWTAQMFLIFKLGRPDVMPAGDLGVQEGLRRLDGRDDRPSPKQILERAEIWRPLRTVASWVLWRLTDDPGLG